MDPIQPGPEHQGLTTDLKNARAQSLNTRIVIAVVILSLIFGAMGGVGGVYYSLRSNRLQKLLNLSAQSEVSASKVVLQENSAIIDVVKKASPAVVSIVISKDLNKLPGYSLNPFNQDPFFAPFFGFNFNDQQPKSSQPKSSQPNVQEVGAGSGFLISAGGLILTNKHVVSDEQASYTVITNDGKSFEAKVLSRDPVNDLAIVKIDAKDMPTLSLSDSNAVDIGQRVIAIGNSLGQYKNTVTTGVVSGIGRSVVASGEAGAEDLQNVIQTDAAINPGNSGGPLLNVLGQVIGINTAIDSQGQLVGFAIPANDAQRALASFEKNGKITRPFLGVRYIMLNQALAKAQQLPKDYGALILRGQSQTDLAVVPGSPADKASLAENDIILEVNGQKVEGQNTLSRLLQKFNPGDSLSMKIFHKGDDKDVKVTLGETK